MAVAHHPRVDDGQALLDMVKTLRRFNWERFLITWAAAFHLLTAFTLAFAPYEQIYNAGTRPVFDIASRYVWAGLFLAAGVMCLVLLRKRTTLTQIATWFLVLPLGGAWFTAFALAVLNGRGSAIGVVVWPFLYGPWALAGVRMALGKR